MKIIPDMIESGALVITDFEISVILISKFRLSPVEAWYVIQSLGHTNDPVHMTAEEMSKYLNQFSNPRIIKPRDWLGKVKELL